MFTEETQLPPRNTALKALCIPFGHSLGVSSFGLRSGTVAVSAEAVPLGSPARIRTWIPQLVRAGVLPLDDRNLRPLLGNKGSYLKFDFLLERSSAA